MARRKRTNKQVPAKGRLRDMCDQLWSLAVRDHYDHQCVVCRNGKCEAHHLIPRQHEATRYHLRNGIALCATHHQFDPILSPHQNAAGWLDWLRENGLPAYEWYTSTMRDGWYREFDGTKNAAHYVDVICSLRGFVEPDEFVRIVGKRFSEYLLTQ